MKLYQTSITQSIKKIEVLNVLSYPLYVCGDFVLPTTKYFYWSN